jgi:hypothetical protein
VQHYWLQLQAGMLLLHLEQHLLLCPAGVPAQVQGI